MDVWLHAMLQLWKYDGDSYFAVWYGIVVCVELSEAEWTMH